MDSNEVFLVWPCDWASRGVSIGEGFQRSLLYAYCTPATGRIGREHEGWARSKDAWRSSDWGWDGDGE